MGGITALERSCCSDVDGHPGRCQVFIFQIKTFKSYTSKPRGGRCSFLDAIASPSSYPFSQ